MDEYSRSDEMKFEKNNNSCLQLPKRSSPVLGVRQFLTAPYNNVHVKSFAKKVLEM